MRLAFLNFRPCKVSNRSCLEAVVWAGCKWCFSCTTLLNTSSHGRMELASSKLAQPTNELNMKFSNTRLSTSGRKVALGDRVEQTYCYFTSHLLHRCFKNLPFSFTQKRFSRTVSVEITRSYKLSSTQLSIWIYGGPHQHVIHSRPNLL